MNVTLRPEVAKFIEDQIRAGRFGSPDDAINSAVARLQAEEELLTEAVDDADLAAIQNGLEQLDRGEGRPWEEVRAELRAKYSAK